MVETHQQPVTPVPTMAALSNEEELLQAHAELWNLTFSYLKSMALDCALKLAIPTAIHRLGGAASLPDLLAAVPVPDSKKPQFPRLMRFLAATGIFTIDAASGFYGLTPVSRLLVNDDNAKNLSPFVLSQTNKYHVTAAMRLPDWFTSDEGAAGVDMPFRMAHGTDMWAVMALDPKINDLFNAGLAADTKLAMDFIVTNCGDVFEGIASLVDVAGGTGTAARAIARAFPHVKCSVLDLPNVINSVPADGIVDYIVGDMMESIPPTDAVFLKYVLHDWDDDVCVKILTQCKKAIPESGGKVIIVDMVVGSNANSKAMFEAQVVFDLLMMVVTAGKERDEHQWRKIFMDAGFSNYKTKPVLGFLSIIELYP
ncbi:flavonoid O-methyltransferase-like protein Os11g0303600 [Brachypodium distachyon]|uniref:O-methyltransferase domain-containing protein n=1 Tax=Brachypodium distachyon TaxID=15368 RepID=A0A0Q3HYD0_BRADI|nr:flavonoid O-methyltransferase-like protein Os11g0303600 [Brachypodium distachyon]KQJ98546.1 hypothetical protein BRADI_3g37551v3 [Brachypodium distachyon]|eukprot:XP_003574581.2 flavonoid O-methyltransferase-like protein Os11g0303600 [Brachypodium distachyon]